MKSGYRELRHVTKEDLPLLQIATMKGVDISPLAGGERLLGWSWTKYGFAPVAVIDFTQTQYVVEPHVSWLPWATRREKYEGFKWFLEQWKKVVFLIIQKEHSGFYDQFVNRGLLRKVGVLHVKSAGEEIHMYQKAENE